MNPVIVIPTFYTSTKQGYSDNIVETYDHPTPIDKTGDLPRLLNSLLKVKYLGQIIVLVSADEDIEIQATEKVQQIAGTYKDLNIIVIGNPEFLLIKHRLSQLGITNLDKEISLKGYSALRNLGLLISHNLGYDSVVFLDDDEVVDDPEFLTKAIYGLGKLTRKGVPILAKTGFYYNEKGSYLSKHKTRWYDHFWQQSQAFNEWISRAIQGPRLSRSNHVCGGCLALHREAFKRLSFDPWVVRGEDLDYMLNLRMYGSDIWFDNAWSLRHLPPRRKNEGLRFRQDIYRWIYESKKMEYSKTQIDLIQINPASLKPYPGPFLEPGIEKRVKLTAWLRSLVRKDRRNYRRAAKDSTHAALEYAEENCSKYFKFQFMWPEIMNRVENDQILKSALLQSAARSSYEVDYQKLKAVITGIDPGATGEIHLNLSDK